MKRFALTFASLGASATLLLATPAIARAQGASTKDRLDQAIALYEAFNVEAARPILREIISPGYVQQVTADQRAQAYKYLGASWAVLAERDSAQKYFLGALDFDPFTDLDPTKFAQSELDAFALARAQLFKVAVAQITRQRVLRPQQGVTADSSAIPFRTISTKRANVRVWLALQRDTTKKAELFNGTLENVRTFPWRGVLSDGTYADTGVYLLTISGYERDPAQALRQQMQFRIEHVQEPMEDTLATLNPADANQLLPERYPAIAPWQDLIRGVFVGGLAYTLPLAVDGVATGPHALAAGTFAVGAAVGSWWYRRRNPQIQLNVQENRRRQDVRRQFNAAVLQRNSDRRDRTLLIISPVTAAQ